MYFPALFSAAAAVTLLVGTAFAQTYPNPEGCAGDCYSHDPYIVLRPDGTYFLFNTLDLISIRTSTSLLGPWTVVGSVIQDASIIDLTGNDVLWAPDVSLIGGVYYLFYAVSVSGSQDSAIGYATSATLEPGSWTDHGEVVSSNSSTPYNTIDPNLVAGFGYETGDFFLSWGSYWEDIYQSAATIDVVNKEVTLSSIETQIAYDPTYNGAYVEGSFIYPHGDYYYLFLSVGMCCTYGTNTTPPATGIPYHVNVCRSNTGAVGPYYDATGASCLDGGGTTVLASHDEVYAPGGQGIINDPVYGDVLYYHYLNTSIGLDYLDAKLGWNVLSWGEDGWPSL